MKIGYARVSTEDQNLDLQIEALNNFGCTRIFQEKVSGVAKQRKEFDSMIMHLREGDTVIVWKLDRLGRSVKQLIDLMEFWLKEGISFHSITDGLTINDSAMSRMFYTIIAAFAQLERDLISERTKAGLAEARKKGRIGGRPKGLSDEAKKKARAIFKLHSSDAMSVREIMKALDVKSTSTFYKYLKWSTNEHQIKAPT
ncbi:MAG: recombinase family protein [Calditrichia bacterium]